VSPCHEEVEKTTSDLGGAHGENIAIHCALTPSRPGAPLDFEQRSRTANCTARISLAALAAEAFSAVTTTTAVRLPPVWLVTVPFESRRISTTTASGR
jgi:hypothetical protein